MKKLIGTLIVLLAGMAFSFADCYFNVTVPVNLGVTVQNQEKEDDPDDKYNATVIPFTIGATGEFLTTIGNSSFCLGAKLGGETGTVKGQAKSLDFTGTAFGFTIAPAFGWVFAKKTTKKQIMIYPVAYSGYVFTNCEDDDGHVTLDKNFTYSAFKSGAAFSWQWGSQKWNGFEFGFNIDWNTMLKYDNKKILDNAGGGFEMFLAYKLTIAK